MGCVVTDLEILEKGSCNEVRQLAKQLAINTLDSFEVA
jgi:hypothetical protein